MADVDVTLGLNANQLHSELSDVKTKLGGFASSLQSLGAGFLAGFSVNQIKDAALAALSYGSTIQDLSERFGVSAESLQRFGNVAEKNGGTLEDVAKSFQFLEKNREKALADPTGNLAGHFENLGVSIDDLQSLSAEDLMLKIGQSSLNAADGVATLGKGFFSVRTTLAQIADLGFDKTPIVSNEDIERVDQFDDALKTVQQTIKAMTVTIIGELIPAIGRMMDYTNAPAEALTRLFDKTPQGAAAADQGGTDVAAIAHRHLEEAAGGPLAAKLAPAANIATPEEKKKRSFGEAEGDAGDDDEGEGSDLRKSRGLKKGELDVIGADLEAKEDTQREGHAADSRADKQAANRAAQEQKAQDKIGKLDKDFAKNPAGLTLHDYATKGSGVGAAKAQEAEREEALARQLQLQGNKGLAAEHQSRAEKLKKELGLPSKEDQKDAIKDGLDESLVLQAIKDNTEGINENQ